MAPRTIPRALSAVVLVVMVLRGRPAGAQVNIEVVRRRVEDKPFQATLEASFTGRLGNVRSGAFSAAALAGGGHGPHRAFAQGSVDYSEFFGSPTVAKAFSHVRYNYQLNPVVFGEIFAQIQSDRFQKLTQRRLFGLGPRFLLVSDKELDLSVGTSVMFEHEVLAVDPTLAFPTTRDATRWNSYLSFGYRVGTTTEMVTTVYLQPRLDDFADVRALGEGSLIFKVTKLLIARIGITYRFQSRPPPGVLESDLEVKNSLGVTF